MDHSDFTLADEDHRLLPIVIESSRDCIALIGLDGTLEAISLPGQRALDIEDANALRGRPYVSLWPEQSAPLVEAALARARGGERHVFEAFGPTLKGTPRWWEVTLAPVPDARGVPARVYCAQRDISALRHRVQTLEAALDERDTRLASLSDALAQETSRLADLRRQLSHSEKVKLLGEFVGHIVHDMNNVLGVLASSFRLIRRRALGELPADLLQHGEDAIERGTRIVRQLLDFARGGEDSPEATDIGATLESWRAMLGHLVGDRITLHLEIPKGLPSIMLRRSALQSVLFNLAANARDAMPEGGTLTIGISVLRSALRGEKLRLFVQDTGCGMAPEVLARAGEPFFSTKAEGKGTGLGLASAYEFVRASGGRVEIRSVEGEGTQVSLLLPVSLIVDRASAAPEDDIDLSLHGGAEVMVVEEDDSLREALCATLRALGYSVIEARSTAMALGMSVAHSEIRALLTHARLEGQFPHRLIHELGPRERKPALLMWGDEVATLAAGGVHLPLPVRERELAQRLLEQLGRLPGRLLSHEAFSAAEHLNQRNLPGNAKAALAEWLALARTMRRLPNTAEYAGWGHSDGESFCVEIFRSAGQPVYRYLRLGADLEARLGRSLAGTHCTGESDEGLGPLAQAYARCEAGAPLFDYARVRVGPGVLEMFERLVLPLSDDGRGVTHLIGFVHFEMREPGRVQA